MTAVGGLVTVLTLTALAVLLAFVTPGRYRSLASGGASLGIGIAGIFTGIAAMPVKMPAMPMPMLAPPEARDR